MKTLIFEISISIPSTLSIVALVKKGNLHFSHVLEDGLLKKDLVITPNEVKIENSPEIFLPVQKEVFHETASAKDRVDNS